MPASKRPKPLYQRGEFKLYPRAARAGDRGPTGYEIIWYDAAKRRERSTSAGTSDYRAAELMLDRLFLQSRGQQICETCGRPLESVVAPLLTNAIVDYLLLGEGKKGYRATKNRLGWVTAYIAETNAAVTCAQIDERWVNGFRTWLAAKPVTTKAGAFVRERSLSHVEGCVLQLVAAINATPGQTAQFTNEQPKAVANSPTFRADVPTLAKMFRWCLYPEGKWIRSDKERDLYVGYRSSLLRFLRCAVATWARPEEIFDLTDRQWASDARVLDLNPQGRRQTKKFRTKIPVARQFAPFLDDFTGSYMPTTTVWAAWRKMRDELGLPDEGQAGIKLPRRSMSTLVRKRIGEAQWQQGKMMLGHVQHEISDIYAIPDPANLGLALAATESIIDEIEKLAPGAFYRAVTANGSALMVVKGGLSA